MKFLARLRSGESMTDLCREFEISRKTGYKFTKRFEQLGVMGLLDQRRVPERIPHRTPDEVRALIIALRKERPTWGAKKLRASLVRCNTDVRFPATSTISEILKHEGLVTPRRRRIVDEFSFSPLSHAALPNDVWCIDYKGQFRLRNGRYCYPLTLTDARSRYVLACEGFDRISGEDVRAVLEATFKMHGLPGAMRFDGGPPFASKGLRHLSKISVWWLRLGIKLEQIEPASPEQNGRHERMHRTLKAETTRPPATSLLQQQERFDRFQDVFNRERPHEALAMACPSDVYVRSPRSYEVPGTLAYPFHDLVARVTDHGHVRVPGSRRADGHYFVTAALGGELVGLRELADGRWLVSFMAMDLGIIDLRERRFVHGPLKAPPSTAPPAHVELPTPAPPSFS